MRTKPLIIAMFISVLAIAASAQFTTPRAVVVDLYKKHDAKQSPFWQKKSRALIGKYFTKQLADLIWKDAHGPDDEAPTLDGDPLYNAQDADIKAFKIGSAATKGKTATVPVSFTNFAERKNIKFSLQRVGSGWKIDNIFYEGNETLLNWLRSDND